MSDVIFSGRDKRRRRDRRARRTADHDAKLAASAHEAKRPNTEMEMSMASEKQIAANRMNAQKSTGPRTTAGKAVARYNALTHGLTAARIVIYGENPQEFEAFQSGIFAELKPATPLQAETVAQIVATLWRLRRIPELESAITARHTFKAGLGDYDELRLGSLEPGHKELRRRCPTLAEERLEDLHKQGEMLARDGLGLMVRILGYEDKLTRLLDRLLKRLEKLKAQDSAVVDLDELDPIDSGMADDAAIKDSTESDQTLN